MKAVFEILLTRQKINKKPFLSQTLNKKSIFFLMTSLILAQSAQFYFLIRHFNEKSKSVKMCKKIIYILLNI